MAYVAVTGGREAIEQSLKLLEIFRDSKEDMTVSAIKENMGRLASKSAASPAVFLWAVT